MMLFDIKTTSLIRAHLGSLKGGLNDGFFLLYSLKSRALTRQLEQGLRYKTFFVLNSTEHELFPAHKCENANNCWHFNIYEREI